MLFAQEVILGHFALTSFAPLVLASVTATIVSQAWFGNIAAFTVPAYQITSYLEVPAFVLLGIVAAAVAVIYQVSLIGTDWVARSIRMPLVARPVVGGLLIGLIAIWFPEVLGVGYDELTLVLEGHPQKLDDFAELLEGYGVVALQRTGRVALPRIERRRPQLSAVDDAS